MNDAALIESLLYRGESDTLDFKLIQYDFEAADDASKSELLKDILAFANAWRDTPAHIVIGVRDGSREIVGLNKDIDDSRLQQFINGKTNRPLRFEYRSLSFQGTTLGLYTIPVQDRPFYSKKTFGNVKAEAVYVRRGSATDTAKPDEIARMGAASAGTHATPKLKVRVLKLGADETPEEGLTAEIIDCTLPDDIPNYPENEPTAMEINWGIVDHTVNSDYYHRLGDYLRERAARVGFKLVVENTGDSYAEDLKITLKVPTANGFELKTRRELSRKPRTNWEVINTELFRVAPPPPQHPVIDSTRDEHSATFHIKKVQAGDSVHTDELFFLYPQDTLAGMNIRVHSDQLRTPIALVIPVSISTKTVPLTVDHLRHFARENANT